MLSVGFYHMQQLMTT